MVRLHAGSFNHCQMSCIATTATNLGIRFVAVKFYQLLFSFEQLSKSNHTTHYSYRRFTLYSGVNDIFLIFKTCFDLLKSGLSLGEMSPR